LPIEGLVGPFKKFKIERWQKREQRKQRKVAEGKATLCPRLEAGGIFIL